MFGVDRSSKSALVTELFPVASSPCKTIFRLAALRIYQLLSVKLLKQHGLRAPRAKWQESESAGLGKEILRIKSLRSARWAARRW